MYFINKRPDSEKTKFLAISRKNMSNYQRSTRECSVTQLNPELRRAMLEYFQTHNLGELETEVIACCETNAEKKPGSWLSDWLEPGSDATVFTGIVLTAQSLVWARTREKASVLVVGADLMNIRTRAHVSFFSKDLGLEVTGLIENSKNNIHGIIGLGPEPAAQKFCDEVAQAIEKINPAPVRKFPRWMGGQ
jgi:hypothetical protein